MPKNILVASPHPAFGELLRISLEESGRYRVRLVQSCEQAARSAQEDQFDLFILDADLRDPSLTLRIGDFARSDRAFPMIVIPPDNNLGHPLLKNLHANASLNKPFYLPDLLIKVDRLSGLAPALAPMPEKEQITQKYTWMKTNKLAGEVIQNLLRETTAEAALILQDGSLLIFNGQMSFAAAEELTSLISRTWQAGRKGDLVRFARLEYTGEEILIYASRLEEHLLLAMIYPPSMPLTRVRAQVLDFMERLAELQPPEVVEEPAHPAEEDTFEWLEEGPEELPAIDLGLLELLASAPSPDPSPTAAVNGWIPETEAQSSDGFLFPWEVKTAAENQPQPVTADQAATQPLSYRKNPSGNNGDTQPIGGRPGSPPPPGFAAQTAILRPVYTCLLIPRRPDQRLEGKIAAELDPWIRQFCQSFGWQLTDLAIQPEYLQWTVEVAPAVSPGYLARILRQQSSLRIFARFPELGGHSPAEEFWAPGYLIVSGKQPPAQHLLHDFIQRTRQRQGFALP